MKQLFLVLCFFLANVHAKTLPDPTKPSPNKSIFNNGEDSSSLTPKEFKLTAIINNSQSKQAIINGESFTLGQQVQGYKVIFISQNHVLLDSADGQQTLYVNNNNIKKDTNNGF